MKVYTRDTELTNIGLSTRIINVLSHNNIETIGDFQDAIELVGYMSGLGGVSIYELRHNPILIEIIGEEALSGMLMNDHNVLTPIDEYRIVNGRLLKNRKNERRTVVNYPKDKDESIEKETQKLNKNDNVHKNVNNYNISLSDTEVELLLTLVSSNIGIMPEKFIRIRRNIINKLLKISNDINDIVIEKDNTINEIPEVIINEDNNDDKEHDVQDNYNMSNFIEDDDQNRIFQWIKSSKSFYGSDIKNAVKDYINCGGDDIMILEFNAHYLESVMQPEYTLTNNKKYRLRVKNGVLKAYKNK